MGMEKAQVARTKTLQSLKLKMQYNEVKFHFSETLLERTATTCYTATHFDFKNSTRMVIYAVCGWQDNVPTSRNLGKEILQLIFTYDHTKFFGKNCIDHIITCLLHNICSTDVKVVIQIVYGSICKIKDTSFKKDSGNVCKIFYSTIPLKCKCSYNIYLETFLDKYHFSVANTHVLQCAYKNYFKPKVKTTFPYLGLLWHYPSPNTPLIPLGCLCNKQL